MQQPVFKPIEKRSLHNWIHYQISLLQMFQAHIMRSADHTIRLEDEIYEKLFNEWKEQHAANDG